MKRELKNFIWNILTLIDDVDERGLHLRRTTYKKDFYRGALSLKEKILKQIEYGFVDEKIYEKIDEKKVQLDQVVNQIEWSPKKESPKKKKLVAERFNEEKLELTSKEIAALKICYQEREELPENMTQEIFDEFEKLIV